MSVFERNARYLFLAPALIYVLGFSIFPLLFSLYLSLTSWQVSMHGAEEQFIGLANFVSLLGDSRFLHSLAVTVGVMACALALQSLVGLLIGILLSQEIRFKNFYRIVYALPMMMAPIAVASTWRMLLDADVGVVNFIIKRLGGPLVLWRSDPVMAIVALILVDSWQWTPFVILVILAGLQGMPVEPFEAADVDGASRMQKFLRLTLPMITPVMTAIILLRALDLIKLFDTVYLLTGGGPGTASETTTLYIYYVGISTFRIGYASAAAFVVVAISLVIGLIFIRVVKRIR